MICEIDFKFSGNHYDNNNIIILIHELISSNKLAWVINLKYNLIKNKIIKWLEELKLQSFSKSLLLGEPVIL